MIFDAVKIELMGAALSDINDRYVDGLIQFGGPTGQIRGIMAWDVSTLYASIYVTCDCDIFCPCVHNKAADAQCTHITHKYYAILGGIKMRIIRCGHRS